MAGKSAAKRAALRAEMSAAMWAGYLAQMKVDWSAEKKGVM